MFWYVYTYNRFFIYNIIYVIKHILCYVVFITKMLEIKQNELNTHVCIIYPEAGYQQLYFIPDKPIFIPKIFYTFGQCVNFKNSL